jgi:dTMP kinase
MKKGKFIVLSGPDQTGKSTQVSLLVDFLTARGISVIRTREPGGTTEGDHIRMLLLDPSLSLSPKTELLLFLASREEHLNKDSSGTFGR